MKTLGAQGNPLSVSSMAIAASMCPEVDEIVAHNDQINDLIRSLGGSGWVVHGPDLVESPTGVAIKLRTHSDPGRALVKSSSVVVATIVGLGRPR